MPPRAFYLRNHTASDLHAADLATLPTLSTRPSFPDKPTYARWCHDARTTHVFYTLAEPANPALRSSGQNPIKFLHGLVADYDGAAEAIQAALPQLKFAASLAPTWVTTTFSGKARLIWVFAQPVPTFSPEVFTRFLTILTRDLGLRKLLPGLDEGALIANPHTPYELGTAWRQPYGDTRLPGPLVAAALHDASAKAKWKTDGPDLPLEAVAAEVARRWPGRWTSGAFTPGARGIRFWDTRADNPTGCTLRAEGVQAWTGECKFIPWAELLGADFVKQYRINRIGGAIDGTYYDGLNYWQRDEIGHWRDLNTEAIKRHLSVLHGLSADTRKGQPSEVAQALTTIDRAQRVDGAFPCLFIPDTVVHEQNQKYLNISRTRCLPHTDVARDWGDGFPWLAAYLRGLFPDEKQSQVFLSWLAWFYQNAAAGKPRKGHALFLAGPPAVGKTFLSQRVIGGLMGGFQEASNYVLGRTSFNENLFYAPVWAIDDGVASANPSRHEEYSQMVKKVIANPYQEYHPKFKKAVSFRFHGRLVVTLNNDPRSITMLPQLDGTILDKLVGLVASAPGVSFADADETVARELPYFADYIARWTIPPELATRPDESIRFGHDAFMHPELLQTAREASDAHTVSDVLDCWRLSYFRLHDQPTWEGTPFDLYLELHNDEVIKPILPKLIPSKIALGRDLQTLIRQGCPWVTFRRTPTRRLYAIARPEQVATEKRRGG